MEIKNLAFFFHIPKTAGTSIESVFGGCPHPKKTEGFEINYSHAFPSEINTALPLFTFVRNPWDRVVSYFFHLKKQGIINEGTSFNCLIASLSNDFKVYLIFQKNHKLYERRKRIAKMILPAYRWTKEGMLIGKQENLQEDFNIICDKIGILRHKLPHKNKTKHKHYAEYYNNETREIVAEKYATDIEHFGYEFGE